MATDWYRNDAWTPHISAEFERRLARARAHNRPEYLRVQGGQTGAVILRDSERTDVLVSMLAG